MKTKEKDHVINFLLTQMTYIMLAKSPVKDALQKAAEKHENRLRTMLTKDELEPIGQMRDTVVELARFLVDCQDSEALNHAYEYMKDLIEGKVLIAMPTGADPGDGFTEVGKSYLVGDS